MNSDTFEQFLIAESQLGNKATFLKEGMVVTVLMMGDRPLDVSLPNFVELKIVESAMATRTDTVTAQTKTAVLETGHNIDVPVFIKEGDIIKIDTRTGSYVERVTTKK
jgi:elongation factor P